MSETKATRCQNCGGMHEREKCPYPVPGYETPLEAFLPQKPAGISGDRLTALIANAHRLLRRRYKGLPLWALVSDLTGNGGSTSVALCREAGYDPSQPCGGRYLRNP